MSVRNSVAWVDTLDMNQKNIFMLYKVHKLEGRNIPKLITTCLTVQRIISQKCYSCILQFPPSHPIPAPDKEHQCNWS